MTPTLIAVTDIARLGWERTERRLEMILARSVPGAVAVQLRDRSLSAGERYRFGKQLRKLTRDRQQWLLINDRLDLALALEADGVHLGEQSVGASEARQLLGPSAWISAACHALDELTAPRLAQADAIVLSPVFQPRKGNPALGLGALREGLQAVGAQQSLYALGGADADAARRCRELGCGVAAIGALYDGPEPRPLLAALDIACQ